MKKSILLLTFIFMAVWTVSAVAEPVAPLATLNAFGKQSFAAKGKSVADVEKDIPSKEMVGIPAYPGSLYAMGGESNGELSSVQLISKASPEDVIAWYQKNLGKAWQYVPSLATKEMGEVGIFVKTDIQNISVMDSFKCQQLSIRAVEKPGDTGFIEMVFDVKGIKSTILMTIKPMM